jgi:hypothetical protein
MLLLGKMKVEAMLEDFQKRKRSSAEARRVQQLFFQIFINDGKGNQLHRWDFKPCSWSNVGGFYF